MSYAKNTSTPVIRVSGAEFYAVVNGVWFKAKSPEGPWKVADKVPPVIYTIPPSCPVFYATNVSVYSSTPETVFVGYTPGYYGPCLAPEGVIVFGTGYAYPPYIGADVWIGPPLTYGFGAGFACGLTTGLAFGLAFDHGWGCSPWWGPWHGGWGNANVNINRNWNNVNVNRTNVYNHWGNNVNVSGNTVNKTNVSARRDNVDNHVNTWKDKGYDPNHGEFHERHPDAGDEIRRDDAPRHAERLGDDNVFAGSDGRAYRSSGDGGWQRFDDSGWKGADRSSGDSVFRGLDNDRAARSFGGFRGGGRR